MALRSINPYTGELISQRAELTENESNEIIALNTRTFEKWKNSSFDERRKLIKNTASHLRSNSGKYASVITSEMGKPVTEAIAEVKKCAWVCDYYADNAGSFLANRNVETDASLSYVVYEPLGTILGIMPWNFPFWQVFRFAVPTLMAGNTIVLKHASGVQLCALEIENIFRLSGFPDYVFSNLAVSSGKMEKTIANKRIKAISLTGSEHAGRKVAEIAGRELKKTVLELGGSNAFIVLDDADISLATTTAVSARFQNAGQSCIAAKRFIVHKKVSDQFISGFRKLISQIKTGNPADPDIQMGPLSSVAQAESVEEQLKASVDKGANIIEGGKREKAMFTPTLVTNVKPGMPLFDEEVFGPVAPVTIADDEEEAINLARETGYGLGVTLFTHDISRAKQISSQFNDGSVFINGLVRSDPRLPFGGTGNSGYGRELSVEGIREFVNVKTVWIR